MRGSARSGYSTNDRISSGAATTLTSLRLPPEDKTSRRGGSRDSRSTCSNASTGSGGYCNAKYLNLFIKNCGSDSIIPDMPALIAVDVVCMCQFVFFSYDSCSLAHFIFVYFLQSPSLLFHGQQCEKENSNTTSETTVYH